MKKWHDVMTRDYTLSFNESVLRVFGNSDYFDNPITQQFIRPDENGMHTHVVNKSEFKSLRSECYNLLKEPRFSKFKEEFMEVGDSFLDYCRNISEGNMDERTDEDLIKEFKKVKESLVHFHSVLSAAVFVGNTLVSEDIERIVKEEVGEDHDEYSQVISFALSPIQKSGILELDKKLSKIEDDQKLEELYQEYRWIPCMDMASNPWTKQEFLDYAEDAEYKEKPKYNLERLKERFNIPDEKIQRIKTGKEVFYLKDLRDEYRRKAMYHLQSLFEEIAERLGTNRYNLSYLITDEIIKAFKEGLNEKKIKERKKGYLLYPEGKSIECITGEDIGQFLKDHSYSKGKNEEKEIRGKVANRSGQNVEGIVKIVNDRKDLDKIGEGDILVAVKTNPEYVGGMKKAKAIVTDEGGLTSHAAIASREMEKPCIVGTKTATEVLSDEDKIIVDTEEGSVKIV